MNRLRGNSLQKLRAKQRRMRQSALSTIGTRKSNRPKSTWTAQRRQAMQVLGRKRLPKKQLQPSLRKTMGIQHPDRFQRKGKPQMKPDTKTVTRSVTKMENIWDNTSMWGGRYVLKPVTTEKEVTQVVGHKITSWPVKKLRGRKKGKAGGRPGRKSMLGAGPSGGRKTRGKGKHTKQGTKGMRGGDKKKRSAKRAKQ